MSPAEADPLAVAEAQLFHVVLLMVRMRLQAAAEERLRSLEAAAGRELPEVRTQLANLFGEEPERLAIAETPMPVALTSAKRGRGRPPKLSPDQSSLDDSTTN